MIAYLASPYMHEDPLVRGQRFLDVSIALGIFMVGGDFVYSPIAMTHNTALLMDLPKSYEFWHSFNCAFIDKCDEFWILCIDGWKESKGVMAEMNYAATKKKRIIFWRFDEAKQKLSTKSIR